MKTFCILDSDFPEGASWELKQQNFSTNGLWLEKPLMSLSGQQESPIHTGEPVDEITAPFSDFLHTLKQVLFARLAI
jgi:hypothetical protein